MAQLPTTLPFSKRRLAARVVISYILDYVFIVAFVIGFWQLNLMQPFHQHFSLDDKSLQYPYAVKERISIYEALLISLIAPLVIIIVFTLLLDGLFSHHKSSSTDGGRKSRGPYRFKDRLWELNCGILGLLLSQATAFVITQIFKTACGRPRPDFIDRCQPAAGSHDPPVYGLSNSTICQGDPNLIKDGFRSWPSGHSSSSFAGLFYLSLYLGGKMHIMDNRGEVWKTVIVVIPCVAASMIALSRIMDARHHGFDVISGSLLGILTAWLAYRLYFPSLSEPWRKGRAYPIRSWGTEPTVPPPVAYSSEETIPLRNFTSEGLYAERQLARASHEIPDQPASQQQQPGAVRNKRSDRDTYASSSSEDETAGYDRATAGGRRRSNVKGPAAASYQPYDTSYYSPGPSTSPPNAESGNGQRYISGEV